MNLNTNNAWLRHLEQGEDRGEPAARRQPEPKRRPPVSEAQKRALQRAGRK